jgi:hypothetical protein
VRESEYVKKENIWENEYMRKAKNKKNKNKIKNKK